MGGGRQVQGEGTYVYLWLIHIDVWQKPREYCKAIILQLTKKGPAWWTAWSLLPSGGKTGECLSTEPQATSRGGLGGCVVRPTGAGGLPARVCPGAPGTVTRVCLSPEPPQVQQKHFLPSWRIWKLFFHPPAPSQITPHPPPPQRAGNWVPQQQRRPATHTPPMLG